MDLDEELRGLSRELDDQIGGRSEAFRPPRRSARPLVVGVVAVGLIAAGIGLATAGSDELDVATSPTTIDGPDPSGYSAAPTTTTVRFVDPPVVDDRPLRLGIDRDGYDASAASDECLTDGPRAATCAFSVNPDVVPPADWWVQILRAQPAAVPTMGVTLQSFPSEMATGDVSVDALAQVVVPDGVGYLLPSSTDAITRVGWTSPSGGHVVAQVADRPRSEALDLIASLRPRSSYGYDLPDGDLIAVVDTDGTTPPRRGIPSSITYRVGTTDIAISAVPGDRLTFEALRLDGIPVRNLSGGPMPGPDQIVSVRGHQAAVRVGSSGSTDAAGVTTEATTYLVRWFEPERGQVVQVRILNNAPDGDLVGLDVLDDLVELDERTFQDVVARTPIGAVAPTAPAPGGP